MDFRKEEEVSSSSVKKIQEFENPSSAKYTPHAHSDEESSHHQHRRRHHHNTEKSPIRAPEPDKSERRHAPSSSRSSSVDPVKSSSKNSRSSPSTSASVSTSFSESQEGSETKEEEEEDTKRKERRSSKNRSRLSSKVHSVRSPHRMEEIRKKYRMREDSRRDNVVRDNSDWSDRRRQSTSFNRDNNNFRRTRFNNQFNRQQSVVRSNVLFGRSGNYYQGRTARLTNSNNYNKSRPDGPSTNGGQQWSDMMTRVNRERRANELEAERLESERRRFEDEKKIFTQEKTKLEEDAQKKMEDAEREEKKHRETLAHCQWWDGRLKDKEAKLMQDSLKLEQRIILFNERIIKAEGEEERLKKKHRLLIQDEGRLKKEKEILLAFVAKCSALCGQNIDNLRKEDFTNPSTPENTNVKGGDESNSSTARTSKQSSFEEEEEGEISARREKMEENSLAKLKMEMSPGRSAFSESDVFETPLDFTPKQIEKTQMPATIMSAVAGRFGMEEKNSNPSGVMPGGQEQLKIIETVLGEMTGPTTPPSPRKEVKISRVKRRGSEGGNWEDERSSSTTSRGRPMTPTSRHPDSRSGNKMQIIAPPLTPPPLLMSLEGRRREDKEERRVKRKRSRSGSGSRSRKERNRREEEKQEWREPFHPYYEDSSTTGRRGHGSEGGDYGHKSEWFNRDYNGSEDNGGGGNYGGDWARRNSQQRYECHRCNAMLIGHLNLKKHLENVHGRRIPHHDTNDFMRQNNRRSDRGYGTELIRRDGGRRN